MFAQVVKRARSQMRIVLNISQQVIDKFAIDGFDPVYGARPLRRVITNIFEDDFTNYLLRNSYGPGAIIKAFINKRNKCTFSYEGEDEEIKRSDTRVIDLLYDNLHDTLINKPVDKYSLYQQVRTFTSCEGKTVDECKEIRRKEHIVMIANARRRFIFAVYLPILKITRPGDKPYIDFDQFLRRCNQSEEKIQQYAIDAVDNQTFEEPFEWSEEELELIRKTNEQLAKEPNGGVLLTLLREERMKLNDEVMNTLNGVYDNDDKGNDDKSNDDKSNDDKGNDDKGNDGKGNDGKGNDDDDDDDD